MSTHDPVSWLELELHALGELDPAAQSRVEHHLATCEPCRDKARAIAEDSRALPPLPLPLGKRRWLNPRLALAATLLVSVSAGGLLWRGTAGDGVKGSAQAIVLVRSRAGAIDEAPRDFRAGDRFKLLVTCTPSLQRFVVVSLREGTRPERSVVLRTSNPIACGNRVALEGAFSLSGTERAEICAHFVERRPADAEVEPTAEEPCISLDPAP